MCFFRSQVDDLQSNMNQLEVLIGDVKKLMWSNNDLSIDTNYYYQLF